MNSLNIAGIQHEHLGRPAVDLTGLAFGRWMVLSPAGKDPRGHFTWLCRYDCGIERVVSGSELRLGRSRSCGCLKAELSHARMIENNPARGKQVSSVPAASASGQE